MGFPSENCLLPKAQKREIECPVCQDVLEKAKFVTACGHKFCESCLDDLQRAGNHTCPVCRKQLSPNIPDTQVRNFIAELKFKCSRTDGCTYRLGDGELDHKCIEPVSATISPEGPAGNTIQPNWSEIFERFDERTAEISQLNATLNKQRNYHTIQDRNISRNHYNRLKDQINVLQDRVEDLNQRLLPETSPEPPPEPCFKVCWRNNWACCLTVFLLLTVLTGATIILITQNHNKVPLPTTTTVSTTTTITTTTPTTSTFTTTTSTTTDGGQQNKFSILLCILIFGLFHLA